MRMRSVSTDVFKNRVLETMNSVMSDAEAGKLYLDEDAHPFARITQPLDEGIEPSDLASLIVERLSAQGYSLFFDEIAARKFFDEALARAGQKMKEASEKDQ